MSTYKVLPVIERTIDKLISEFGQITDERKSAIAHLKMYIAENKDAEKKILLNFICTHNSRRSHISQIWAQTAEHYYGIDNVETFSGGTEATAFNPRAVTAMKQAGFDITAIKDGENPVYKVKFSNDARVLTVFSKRFDDDFNPKTSFAAVMTCSHADDNCPFIPGAKRIALTFDDPKEFDGTPQESAKYSERVNDIGREILYAFSLVK
jgi:arsenate reductase